MLQLSVLRLPGRGLRLPTRVRSLRIDPSIHLETVKGGSCDVKVDPKMDMVVAGGVELRGKPLRLLSHHSCLLDWSILLLCRQCMRLMQHFYSSN